MTQAQASWEIRVFPWSEPEEILGKLDVGWTKAMWPKQAYPDKMHQLYFQIGTRATFAAGFGFAVPNLWICSPSQNPVRRTLQLRGDSWTCCSMATQGADSMPYTLQPRKANWTCCGS